MYQTSHGKASCIGVALIAGWLCSACSVGCAPAVPPDPFAGQRVEVSGPVTPGTPGESDDRDPQPLLDGQDGRPLALDLFRPRAMLKVPQHPPQRAKFPVVDVHMHPRIRLKHSPEMLDDYVRLMDEQNIALSISLDGGMGEAFDEHERYLARHAGRFLIFANLDFRGAGREDAPATWDCLRPDFGRRMAVELERLQQRGVCGLKLFKQFGLEYRNADGSLLKIDDPRWDPIWEACGKLGLVVIMHTADPAAFFEPIDATNERWEELHRHPEWSFFGPTWPAKVELLAARNRVIARHRDTTFLCAHMANDGEDLAEVGTWLDEHPNMMVELAARIAELGRQPYTARAFFLKYADRILFGTDGPRVRERLLPHWRFLETQDEFFPYAENPFPPQGFWNIYGLGLPDDVLQKVYHENAKRLIRGVQDKVAAFQSQDLRGETTNASSP